MKHRRLLCMLLCFAMLCSFVPYAFASGGGWTHNCFCPAAAIAIASWGELKANSIEIRNNTMLGSTMSLLFLYTRDDNVLLSDNNYFCTSGDLFTMLNYVPVPDAGDAESLLGALGESGTFVRLP